MNKNFNEKLKELRLDKCLNQKEIAKRLGVSVTCYAGYEQGYRQPDLKMLTKICLLYGVSADYLLGLSDEY
ncbi:MAG: helix-turn-helix transcriptional regulator [Clostridiales bacterium]|nr:helix-turn-helix transcriptional regulator [Clostridiales bacterium]